jgi:hypothetical protein
VLQGSGRLGLLITSSYRLNAMLTCALPLLAQVDGGVRSGRSSQAATDDRDGRPDLVPECIECSPARSTLAMTLANEPRGSSIGRSARDVFGCLPSDFDSHVRPAGVTNRRSVKTGARRRAPRPFDGTPGACPGKPGVGLVIRFVERGPPRRADHTQADRWGQIRRRPTPRPGVTAAATTAVFATGDGPGETAFATTAVFAIGWPMTPALPTRAALSGMFKLLRSRMLRRPRSRR